jgi:hypothetical protein
VRRTLSALEDFSPSRGDGKFGPTLALLSSSLWTRCVKSRPIAWRSYQRPALNWIIPRSPRHPAAAGMLFWLLFFIAPAFAHEGKELRNQATPAQDTCQPLIRRSTTHLRHVIDSRLMQGFPMTVQLEEGNARLSPLSTRTVDCEQQRVVVSATYEFRGNLGVMDITRRGTTVLQFHLNPKPAERQVWLEAPEVLDVTFDNPAPWFDGKAISNWALSLFPKPVCANLHNGQPC